MSTAPRRGPSFLSLLLLALLMLALGAAGAVWALTRWDAAAALVGVRPAEPAPPPPARALAPAPSPTPSPAPAPLPADALARVGDLEARLARVESATTRAAGSAGRADALLIAFAARRAIDRGVPLGYLEPLLSSRFGQTHRQAVATIVTASRRPVRLDQLAADFDALEPMLKRGDPDEGMLAALRRELGSLVTVRHADRPSPRPSPTYERAKARLASGQVDQALAEAMRLPGIAGAEHWVADARTYVATHRALDEVETAALLVP